jgi:beta-galactosidase
MIGEYWDGWFDHWGRPHHTTEGQEQAEIKEIGWLLERGDSINFYMFHGGTTWDFMNGANSDGPDDYWPDTTSYDYSAPLDESGRPTEKYFLFRQLIAQHTGKYLPDVPNLPKAIQIPEFCLNQSAPLFANLPQPTRSDQPLTMESLGQSYGYTLYRTQIAGPGSGNLDINVRDYAAIYVDGRLAGTLDRRLNESRLPLRIAEPKTRLDILVENMGRVNFGQALRSERKGIASVFWNGKEVTGWEIFSLPMDDLSSLRFGMTGPGPTFYRGTFDLAETGDTFLDLGSWSKGTVWVNGHHLGRFWSIGPQQTLYVPGPWLKHENNEVVVFAGRLQSKPVMRGLSRPVLDDLREPHPALKKQTSK